MNFGAVAFFPVEAVLECSGESLLEARAESIQIKIRY